MNWMIDKDLEKYNKVFQKNKLVIIPNALSTDLANLLYDSIEDINDGNLWYQSQRGNLFYNNKMNIKSHHDFLYKFDKFPLSGSNLKSLIGLKGDSRRLDYQDVLPFQDNPERELPENHPLRKFSAFLATDIATSPIKSIVGYDVPNSKPITFLSRYMAGDFLTTHDDSGLNDNRLITFILSLSKGWKHHWGGQTLFFENEDDNVAQSISPEFNSLIIFEVPMNHCVLPVSTYANKPRYSISGWFLK
jgi:hypothetical protein